MKTAKEIEFELHELDQKQNKLVGKVTAIDVQRKALLEEKKRLDQLSLEKELAPITNTKAFASSFQNLVSYLFADENMPKVKADEWDILALVTKTLLKAGFYPQGDIEQLNPLEDRYMDYLEAAKKAQGGDTFDSTTRTDFN